MPWPPTPVLAYTGPAIYFTGLLPSIIAYLSAGADLTFNIEFSNDGVNFNPDTASSGLSASINYSITAAVAYWRLNVTAYISGSVTATIRLPSS
jgi:hypothetical protein